ncbi:zinc finger protein interacting with ribonucleoprotein K-like isoform X2 [Ambystoma mexicanum]|uniref:zinc finger protein interacting with ribonucleoprotein K-like isoform X2 n=1 Tax=Ambystoma mexicanum TaxID=8296 RepID=UPI0037E73A5E
MFQQDAGKVADTFYDASSYFSNEEWKLLHQWQKELYINVMKEIHQALISLGPVIASTVFSLREKENQALCTAEKRDTESHHDSTHSTGGVTASSITPFSIKGEINQHLKDPRETDGRESSNYLCTAENKLDHNASVKSKSEEGYSCCPREPERCMDSKLNTPECYPAIHPDILLPIPEEQELNFKDWPASDSLEMSKHPTKGFPLPNADICQRKEERPKDVLRAFREHSTGPSPGHEVISFIIKDEEEACSLDHHDSTKKGRIDSPKEQDGGMRRQRKRAVSAEFNKKTPTWKGARYINMKVPWIPEKKKYPRSQLWSENYLELGGEKPNDCHTGFGTLAHINVHQGILKVGSSEPYNDGQSNLGNAPVPPCLTIENQVQRLYPCTECERSYDQKVELIRHFRTHTGARPYACTECKKSFFKKGDFTRHRRTHTGEKPYLCTDCHKSFNRKGNLDQHKILIHSGVRPFKCNECDKSFSRQCHLNKHMIKHKTMSNVTFLNSMM